MLENILKNFEITKRKKMYQTNFFFFLKFKITLMSNLQISEILPIVVQLVKLEFSPTIKIPRFPHEQTFFQVLMHYMDNSMFPVSTNMKTLIKSKPNHGQSTILEYKNRRLY